jgi:YD repeat-containing protein
VFVLLFLSVISSPPEVWARVQKTYVSAATYRGTERAHDPFGASIELRARFKRGDGLIMTGREKDRDGNVQFEWTLYGQPTCLTLYDERTHTTHSCRPDQTLPMIGYLTGPAVVLPMLLAGASVQDASAERMTVEPGPDPSSLKLTILTPNGDPVIYTIDRRTSLLRHIEQHGMGAAYEADFDDVALNEPMTDDVAFHPPIAAFPTNHPAITFALWCALLCAIAFLTTSRTYASARGWRRLAIATATCIGILLLLFAITFGDNSGHPPAIIIVPIAGLWFGVVLLSAFSWMMGRQLRLTTRGR